MGMLTTIRGWFSGHALRDTTGKQLPLPGQALVPDTANVGPDGALQISTVWACIDRRAAVVSSLPFFVYDMQADGQKTLARNSRLYGLLHESPNTRMTPMEFWRAMMLSHDLRGAGYARIDRDERTGEAIALWPMHYDQTQPIVLPDGSMVYEYRIDQDVAILAAENVLVIKGLGNGTTGLDKLAFMRSTTDESAKAQASASKLFGSGGKPTGVLMIDHVLKPEQRRALLERFSEMASGNTSRLFLLEANMQHKQLSLSPEDQQLLETRRFSVEEICRWFDVPPVLVHHSNVTTWGSGVEQIVTGWFKMSIGPMLVNIQQAVRKRVMTPGQRARQAAELAFEALLRADTAARSAFYASALQNGYMTRNEVRQLENLPPATGPGASLLTAQSNLLPIDKLGSQQLTGGSNAPAQAPVAQ